MRFKAQLAPEQISFLYSLIVPISRLASSSSNSSSGEHQGAAASSLNNRNNAGCILFLDQTRLCISIKGQSNDTDGIVCFAELQAASGIFLEHRIESAAPDNAIVLEVDILQLRMALQSVANEHRSNNNNNNSQAAGGDTSSSMLHLEHVTILKLAKRSNVPCLLLDSVGGSQVAVHHTIPVRVLRPAEMQFHYPPVVPLPNVQLELDRSTVATVKTVIDRLSRCGGSNPTVFLEGNMKKNGGGGGELTLHVDNDGASIRTFFSKLHPCPADCKVGADTCCVKVDTKKLLTALQWSSGGGGNSGTMHQAAVHSGIVSTSTLCLVENEMVIVHAVLKPASVGFFTYYVPVHYLTADDSRDD